MRIRTLFPAATEMVFALGSGDALAGVSHECNYPAEAAYFARPGPRIVDSLEILAHIIHPEMVPASRLPGAFRRVRISEHNFA